MPPRSALVPLMRTWRSLDTAKVTEGTSRAVNDALVKSLSPDVPQHHLLQQCGATMWRVIGSHQHGQPKFLLLWELAVQLLPPTLHYCGSKKLPMHVGTSALQSVMPAVGGWMTALSLIDPLLEVPEATLQSDAIRCIASCVLKEKPETSNKGAGWRQTLQLLNQVTERCEQNKRLLECETPTQCVTTLRRIRETTGKKVCVSHPVLRHMLEICERCGEPSVGLEIAHESQIFPQPGRKDREMLQVLSGRMYLEMGDWRAALHVARKVKLARKDPHLSQLFEGWKVQELQQEAAEWVTAPSHCDGTTSSLRDYDSRLEQLTLVAEQGMLSWILALQAAAKVRTGSFPSSSTLSRTKRRVDEILLAVSRAAPTWAVSLRLVSQMTPQAISRNFHTIIDNAVAASYDPQLNVQSITGLSLILRVVFRDRQMSVVDGKKFILHVKKFVSTTASERYAAPSWASALLLVTRGGFPDIAMAMQEKARATTQGIDETAEQHALEYFRQGYSELFTSATEQVQLECCSMNTRREKQHGFLSMRSQAYISGILLRAARDSTDTLTPLRPLERSRICEWTLPNRWLLDPRNKALLDALLFQRWQRYCWPFQDPLLCKLLFNMTIRDGKADFINNCDCFGHPATYFYFDENDGAKRVRNPPIGSIDAEILGSVRLTTSERESVNRSVVMGNVAVVSEICGNMSKEEEEEACWESIVHSFWMQFANRKFFLGNRMSGMPIFNVLAKVLARERPTDRRSKALAKSIVCKIPVEFLPTRVGMACLRELRQTKTDRIDEVMEKVRLELQMRSGVNYWKDEKNLLAILSGVDRSPVSTATEEEAALGQRDDVVHATDDTDNGDRGVRGTSPNSLHSLNGSRLLLCVPTENSEGEASNEDFLTIVRDSKVPATRSRERIIAKVARLSDHGRVRFFTSLLVASSRPWFFTLLELANSERTRGSYVLIEAPSLVLLKALRWFPPTHQTANVLLQSIRRRAAALEEVPVLQCLRRLTSTLTNTLATELLHTTALRAPWMTKVIGWLSVRSIMADHAHLSRMEDDTTSFSSPMTESVVALRGIVLWQNHYKAVDYGLVLSFLQTYAKFSWNKAIVECIRQLVQQVYSPARMMMPSFVEHFIGDRNSDACLAALVLGSLVVGYQKGIEQTIFRAVLSVMAHNTCRTTDSNVIGFALDTFSKIPRPHLSDARHLLLCTRSELSNRELEKCIRRCEGGSAFLKKEIEVDEVKGEASPMITASVWEEALRVMDPNPQLFDFKKK